IYNDIGNTGTDNIINIQNNTMNAMRFSGAGTFYGIYSIGTPKTLLIAGNTIRDVISPSTNAVGFYGIWLGPVNSTAGSTVNVTGNNVSKLNGANTILTGIFASPFASTNIY